MQRLKDLRERISTFSREKPKKFLGIQLLVILAVILVLYPSASAAGSETWAIFVALSLAMFLIPINTYIYERGFVKTSVISLFSAFAVPPITLVLLVLSPGGSLAYVIIFFLVLAASIILGYLLPLIVPVAYFLKKKYL